MAIFDLKKLGGNVVKKILKKVTAVTYFRLHQTCPVYNLLTNKKVIKGTSFLFDYNCIVEDSAIYCCSGRIDFSRMPDNARLATVELLQNVNEEDFTEVFGELKIKGITCDRLCLHSETITSELKEVIVTSLKPTTIILLAENALLYQQFLGIESLTSIEVCLTVKNIKEALPILLTNFSSVQIKIVQALAALHFVLATLRENLYPRIRRFELYIPVNGQIPSQRSLEHIFPGLQWTHSKKDGKKIVTADLGISQPLLENFNIKIGDSMAGSSIYYKIVSA